MNSWIERKRPNRLEIRYEFQNYEDTRDFLDKLGGFCESNQRYPDISFGKTYVNLTLKPENEEPDALISKNDKEFALKINLLLE